VPRYRIAPQPANIRPARRPPGRNEFLPVNCRPGETFLGGESYNGETFLWDRWYFNKRETCQFCDYSSLGGFFMGKDTGIHSATVAIHAEWRLRHSRPILSTANSLCVTAALNDLPTHWPTTTPVPEWCKQASPTRRTRRSPLTGAKCAPIKVTLLVQVNGDWPRMREIKAWRSAQIKGRC